MMKATGNVLRKTFSIIKDQYPVSGVCYAQYRVCYVMFYNVDIKCYLAI